MGCFSLLIAPEGIEIAVHCQNIARRATLLIAPEGIEILKRKQSY